MSLNKEENIPEKYDWGKVDKHDPNAVGKGWSFEGKEGICGNCFGKITQPIIQGIWYHQGHWDIEQKDHEPIPASKILQLYYYFMLPNRSYDKFERTKKCKHSKWWNDCLDFKPLLEGYHWSHYFMPNHISLCGRVMDMKERGHRVDRKRLHPTESVFLGCSKCLEKLVKLGMVKQLFSKHQFDRSFKLKWLIKKVPKEVRELEKSKYTKVLK